MAGQNAPPSRLDAQLRHQEAECDARLRRELGNPKLRCVRRTARSGLQELRARRPGCYLGVVENPLTVRTGWVGRLENGPSRPRVKDLGPFRFPIQGIRKKLPTGLSN